MDVSCVMGCMTLAIERYVFELLQDFIVSGLIFASCASKGIRVFDELGLVTVNFSLPSGLELRLVQYDGVILI